MISTLSHLIIFPGKIKDQFLKSYISNQLERISHYLSLEMRSFKEPSSVVCGGSHHRRRRAGKSEVNKYLETEGRLFLERINPSDYVVVLTDRGRELDTHQFAEFLTGFLTRFSTGGRICWLISGPFGFSSELLQRANYKLSLSKLTYTHELALAVLAEQIFRGCKINSGETYHY